MQPQDTIEYVKNSNEFKEWHKKNKDFFLAHALILVDDDDTWNIGYYSKKRDVIVSFLSKEGKVEIQPEDTVFKKKGATVKKLDISKVKIGFEDALEQVNKLKEKKYKGHDPVKRIVILQQLDMLVWNITYVTKTFCILNAKIDAENSKMVTEGLTPIMQFKQK